MSIIIAYIAKYYCTSLNIGIPVISPHDCSQYVTIPLTQINHNKVVTVSPCRRRTSRRPKSALGYAVVFVCVCCYFRPSIMNQQDRKKC